MGMELGQVEAFLLEAFVSVEFDPDELVSLAFFASLSLAGLLPPDEPLSPSLPLAFLAEEP